MNRKARRMMKAIGLGGKENLDPQAISKEYIQACAEAGELQYKIEEFQESLKELNERIRKLNRSYAEISAEARAKQAEVKPDEAKN